MEVIIHQPWWRAPSIKMTRWATLISSKNTLNLTGIQGVIVSLKILFFYYLIIIKV